jgi:dihydroorotate dehydrogenase electron transfer subunit
MFQIKAKILYNNKVTDSYFHCAVYAPKVAKNALPGQFVNIKISETVEPLLRRPFGIHRVCGSNIEILYEVLGQGTRVLSQRKAGGYLDIIGPLGNGFDYRAGVRSQESGVLVAGGMGVAPLIFLAEKLTEIKNQKIPACRQAGKIKNIVLIGAKTKGRILCEKEFKKLGCAVKVATDDGSKGFKGYVSELLKHELYAKRYTPNAIYACGPKPMLKEVAAFSKKHSIPAQLSLEEHMACGIGACLGCAVNTKEGYKRVCKEGPVFNAEEMTW